MLRILVKTNVLFFLLFVLAGSARATTAEYPLFSKLEGFTLQKKSRSEKFGSYTFKTGAKGKDESVVEGKYFNLIYSLNKGVEHPGGLYIIRNFTTAARQAGGEVLYEKSNTATMRMQQGDKEIWARIHCAANGSWYALDIIEKKTMEQQVAVNPILDAITSTGKATVYINFDTAKSQIKADSQPVIDDIVNMLRQSPDLKLSIEGHTDNDGTPESNQKLSEERSLAVKNALIAQGINASRLAAKGYGLTRPVAENTTEEGKAKNRRVELVRVF